VLREYSQASAKPVVQATEDARKKHVDARVTPRWREADSNHRFREAAIAALAA